ncbi:MAG: hypothetical protein NAOJABEB_01345 [Steroidobacteraceae bacterium]|nr:hypothetical protein [Steroidobacteraceae bacterium]
MAITVCGLRVAALALAVSAAALTAPVASGATGDLDPSFGRDGRAFVDFANDRSSPAGIIQQPDGRLVIGRLNSAVDDDFSVIRLTPDGLLDATFGDGGHTKLDLPGVKGTTFDLLQQPDGKIVVAGLVFATTGPRDTQLGLVRYLVDGSLDVDFGSDGFVMGGTSERFETVNAMLRQDDGRIVVGGRSERRHMIVARFDADGALDRSFGASGTVVINFHGTGGGDEINALALRGDGRLIGVGWADSSRQSSGNDLVVVQLLADGRLDPGFDDDGRAAVVAPEAFRSLLPTPVDVAILPDGKLLIAGYTDSSWDYDGCVSLLARMNSDGTTDENFGNAGVMSPVIDAGCAWFNRGIAVDTNGDALLNGQRTDGEALDAVVIRVGSTGLIDESFGAGGVASVDVGHGANPPLAGREWGSHGFTRQADGKLVLAATTRAGETATSIVVARLLASGSSPGLIGLAKTNASTHENDGAVSVLVRRTGGSAGPVSVDYATIGESASDATDFTSIAGTLAWADGEFGSKAIEVNLTADTQAEAPETFKITLSNAIGGAQLAASIATVTLHDPVPPSPPGSGAPPPTTQGGGGGALHWALLLALGLLTVASKARGSPGDLDTTFGVMGRAVIDTGTNMMESATSLATQADGGILVGGEIYYFASPYDFSVLRLFPTGERDLDFGTNGRASVDLPKQEGRTRAIVVTADGGIVAAGWTMATGGGIPEKAGMVRYTGSGILDQSFGTGGLVSSHFQGVRASFETLIEQADGRLIAGGYRVGQSGTTDWLLARYTAQGFLDGDFGNGGRVTHDIGAAGRDDLLSSLALQEDRKIVAAGLSEGADGISRAALFRMHPDGSPDASFGVNGRVIVDLPLIGPHVQRAVFRLQGDGKFVLALRASATADGASSRTYVIRLRADASLDTSFGAAGVVELVLDNAIEQQVTALEIEPAGSILLGGTLNSESSTDAFVARLNSDGTRDVRFGRDGRTILDNGLATYGSWVDTIDGVRLLRQADGRILVAASDRFDWWLGGEYFIVSRLTAIGSSPGLLGIRLAGITVDEGVGVIALPVRRTGGKTGRVSVAYSTSVDGSAPGPSPGADFSPASGTLTWEDGDAADKYINFTVIDDTISESLESFEVTLTDPAGGADLTTARAEIAIKESDAPAIPQPPPAPTPPPGPMAGATGGGGGMVTVPLLLALALARSRRLLRPRATTIQWPGLSRGTGASIWAESPLLGHGTAALAVPNCSAAETQRAAAGCVVL